MVGTKKHKPFNQYLLINIEFKMQYIIIASNIDIIIRVFNVIVKYFFFKIPPPY